MGWWGATLLFLTVLSIVYAFIECVRLAKYYQEAKTRLIMAAVVLILVVIGFAVAWAEGAKWGRLRPATQDQLKIGEIYRVAEPPEEKQKSCYVHLWWVDGDFRHALFKLDRYPPERFVVLEGGLIVRVD